MKKINNVWLASIFFGVIIISAFGLRLVDYFNVKSINIKIDGVDYPVLIAANDQMRYQGLSNRDSLGRYAGMYFIFAHRGINSMVMRDMRFPLDMVWLNGSVVTDIAENLIPEPGRSEAEFTVYSNKIPGDGVLELPTGFIARHGLKVGETLEIELVR